MACKRPRDPQTCLTLMLRRVLPNGPSRCAGLGPILYPLLDLSDRTQGQRCLGTNYPNSKSPQVHESPSSVFPYCCGNTGPTFIFPALLFLAGPRLGKHRAPTIVNPTGADLSSFLDSFERGEKMGDGSDGGALVFRLNERVGKRDGV